jgi:hypothetical protein
MTDESNTEDGGGLSALTTRHPAREEWLYKLMGALQPYFAEAGSPIPIDRIRIGVGFTSSGNRKNNASIGQCWIIGKDGPERQHEIIVRLDRDKTHDVAAILVHELCHAALPRETLHKAPFRKLLAKFGIQIDVRGAATCKDGEVSYDFTTFITDVFDEAELGEYPHRGVRFDFDDEKKTEKVKASSIPPVRLECECCGVKVSMHRDFFIQAGPPLCGNIKCEKVQQPMRLRKPKGE